jgi:phenylalanyl-tRNA synthetase beta chain
MKISKNWLNDYLDLSDISAESFEDLITTKVAEVEEIEKVGEALNQALICRILKVSSHPTRDKLKIVKIQTGKEEISVVCGAPNVKADTFAIYCPTGSSVYSVKDKKQITLEPISFDGVESRGMLCSSAELEIGSDHSGIILFDEDQKLSEGKLASTVFGETDAIIDIDNKSLTHRPDLWSHFGFAKELSVILERPLKFNPGQWTDDQKQGQKLFSGLGRGKSNYSISIQDPSACRRFSALEIFGVKSELSPWWIRRRLFSVGAGVRNLLVDLSNYVMLDVGQPNHAYDADSLDGSEIKVRFAKDGEKFKALDEKEYQLTKEDLVIADSSRAVALGGVIGGFDSAVKDSTTRLLLESANFDPVTIRKTAKRFDIRTDASNRFEKNRSPYAVPMGTQRFVELLSKLQPSSKIVGSITDSFPNKPESVSVAISFQEIEQRLGVEVGEKKIAKILSGLGFEATKKGKDGQVQYSVPCERATKDISIGEDLVEEIGRIIGYDSIPITAPAIESTATAVNKIKEFEHRLRDQFRALGFSEHYGYSFMNGEFAERCGYGLKNAISIKNPLDLDLNYLRTSLVPEMIRALERNAKEFRNILLFELGRSYETKFSTLHENLSVRDKINNPASFERRLLTLGYISGLSDSELVTFPKLDKKLDGGADFYAVLGVLKNIFSGISSSALEINSVTKDPQKNNSYFGNLLSWQHPFRAASLTISGFEVGCVAEVCPDFIDGLQTRAVIAELDLEILCELSLEVASFKPIARFPESLFEMSIVIKKDDQYRSLEKLLRDNVEASYLKKIEVLDVYQGSPLKDDERSVSVKLHLGTDNQTLSREQLSAIQNRLIDAVNGSEYLLRN